VERQLTVPVETALSGVPDAASIRSVRCFGLSVVTLQFREGSNDSSAAERAAVSRTDHIPDFGPG